MDMNEKFKALLLAADEKRRRWELAASLGDSFSAAELENQALCLERQALALVREQYGLL